MAIVLVAAAVLALIAITNRRPPAPLAAVTPTSTAAAGTPGTVTVRAALTTNVRAAPDRQAELVAIIPGNRVADVTGVTPAGDWLRVVYPPGSRLVGWVPEGNVVPVGGDIHSVAVIDAGAAGGVSPSATPGGTAVPASLPDLTITNAFVAPNGTLTIRVANVGAGRFDGTVGLRVTSAAGEVVGVVDVQQTLLQPGRSATVNTQVVIRQTGEYVLELDWLDEVKESNEFNNTLRTLLVAPSAPGAVPTTSPTAAAATGQ
jgi:hypothetical protein